MRSLLYIGLAIILLSSCKTLIPFTQDLKQDNNWNSSQVEQLQFYSSETITLHRQLKSNSTNIVSGKIKMVNGKEVEEIIIKKGTPGVISAIPDSERLAVSFEINDDYFLTFGIDQKRGGRFYLRLKEYKKGEYAKVTYSNEVFQLSPQSLNAFLQVNMKQINKEQRKLRVAKGRKL